MNQLAPVELRSLAHQQLGVPADPGWSLNPSTPQLGRDRWFVASHHGHHGFVLDEDLTVLHTADFTPPPREPGDYRPQATAAASPDGRTIAHLCWPTLDIERIDGDSFSVDVGQGDDSGGSQIAFTGDSASCLFVSPPPGDPDDDYLLRRLDLVTGRLDVLGALDAFGFFGVRLENGDRHVLINIDQGQNGSTLYRHSLEDGGTTVESGVVFDDISADGTWIMGADDEAVHVSEWPGRTTVGRVRSADLTIAADGGFGHGYLEAMAIGARHLLVWSRPASPVALLLEREPLRAVGRLEFPDGDHRPVAYRRNRLLTTTDSAVTAFALDSLPI